MFYILKVTPDPDPLVRCANPGIRICTKMSRIPNTALGATVILYMINIDKCEYRVKLDNMNVKQDNMNLAKSSRKTW